MCFCMGWRWDGWIIGNKNGREGQTKTSKATGNVALEGIRMKTFHWTNKCGCAALAHCAVPQQVSFTIRDFAEVHIRGSYKA